MIPERVEVNPPDLSVGQEITIEVAKLPIKGLDDIPDQLDATVYSIDHESTYPGYGDVGKLIVADKNRDYYSINYEAGIRTISRDGMVIGDVHSISSDRSENVLVPDGGDRLDHPDHGEIVPKELNNRRHDGEKTWFCTRCNTHVPRDDPDRFDDMDCDQNRKINEAITGSVNNVGEE